jgi:hypothetical protein
MTSEEARMFLHSLGTDRPTVEDPRLVEALELSRSDPELRAWFEEQQALDIAITDKLDQVSPPPNLAVRIMASHRSRAGLRGRRSIHIWPTALAASLALLLTVGILVTGRLSPDATQLSALREDMATFLVTFPTLDLASDELPRGRMAGSAASARLFRGPGGDSAPVCLSGEWSARNALSYGRRVQKPQRLEHRSVDPRPSRLPCFDQGRSQVSKEPPFLAKRLITAEGSQDQG